MCVKRVLESRNATPFDVIVIAADAELARTFSASAGAGDARVRVVDARGVADFDGLVDRAVALHGDRDVVVLRSDADVHGDWLDRLAAHAAGAFVGVVGSFPDASVAVSHAGARRAERTRRRRVDRRAGRVVCARESRAVRHRARTCGVRASMSRAPACRQSKVRVPVQSTPGIGRAISRGAQGTRGSTRESPPMFSRAATSRPKGRAMARVATMLQLFAGRVAIARLAASPRPAIVFVSHAWGGGIRRYMDDVAALVRDRADVLYLEPADALTVKLYSPHGGHPFAMWFRLPEDLPVLAQTLPRDRRRATAFPSCPRASAVDPRASRRERRSVRLHAARLLRDLPAISSGRRRRPLLRRARRSRMPRLSWRAPGAMESRHRGVAASAR